MNVFSCIWNICNSDTFRVSVCMACASLHMILHLTSKVVSQLWLVFFTTLQFPNFYHSSISIFDSRQRSVYYDIWTLLLNIHRQSSPRSRLILIKIVDPTSNVNIIVLCPENAIYDAGTSLNWISGSDNVCTHWVDTWRFSVFLEFLWVLHQGHTFTKIHSTGSKFMPLFLQVQILSGLS